MTQFAWPDFGCNRFDMRVAPNFRAFPNPLTGGAQVADLGGERWVCTLSLVPGKTLAQSGAREAFFDRLLGPKHTIALWHLRRPYPLGTIRDGVVANVVNGSLAAVSVVNGSAQPVTVITGSLSLSSAVAAGASSATLQTVAGRTLEVGDLLGLANGQTVRAMTGGTADANGRLTFEFLPRARTDIAGATAITWNKPTVNFMLKSDGVPTTHRPGYFDGASLELVEAY